MTFVWSTSHVGMLYPLKSGGKKANAIARDFLVFANASLQGTGYDKSKTLLTVDSHQAETRKAFFQEIGLLYVLERSNRISLTSVGKQFAELLQSLPRQEETLSAENLMLLQQRADALLIWALCNSQLNRPSSFGSPKQSKALLANCTVRPYATFWQALRDLGGYVTTNEFQHGLATIHDVKNYNDVIKQILDSRISKKPILPVANFTNNYLIYWKSHLTIAEQILIFDGLQFEFLTNKRNIIETILKLRMCDGESVVTALGSQDWKEEEYYYEEVAGVPCPEFLLRGEFQILDFDKQKIVSLQNYNLERIDHNSLILGGRELCQLPLKAVCFHESEPNHLLRLDAKRVMNDGKVKLLFGLGRPINDLSQLKGLLKINQSLLEADSET